MPPCDTPILTGAHPPSERPISMRRFGRLSNGKRYTTGLGTVPTTLQQLSDCSNSVSELLLQSRSERNFAPSCSIREGNYVRAAQAYMLISMPTGNSADQKWCKRHLFSVRTDEEILTGQDCNVCSGVNKLGTERFNLGPPRLLEHECWSLGGISRASEVRAPGAFSRS